ncbi:MAG: T9SS type A sorting domain-containing protein [candidate division Zixibacteria bacterium]|nr:T9SS type A sorting domain-containing protein [candidate division Zixibacteria bacterium]
MTTRIVSCLVIALVLAASTGLAGEAPRNPEANPAQFRKGLHPDYTARLPRGPIAVPAILPAPAVLAKSADFDDLLVSEISPTANFLQENASAAGLKGGRLAVAWEDNRQGPAAIFLQLFDHNGNSLGGNMALVIGGDNDLNDPRVCADTNGNFFVVWRDYISGTLQAARFDSLANVLTPVFFVSDTTQFGYAGEFDAVCALSGRLVVTWENYASANDIVFRIFQSDGAPVSAVTAANSDLDPTAHWSPAIANGANGDFAIVWEDYRSGDIPDMYFRRFNAAGGDYGTEIPLSDVAARDSARYTPDLAYSAADGFLAAWVDLRSGQNIYIQRMTSAGALDGANVLLTDEAAGYPNWEPSLGLSSSGRFLAAWTQYGSGNSIIAQRFASGVVEDGSPTVVSGATEGDRNTPAVVGSLLGNWAVFWTEPAGGLADIHGALLYNDGGFVKSDFKVNDDASGSPAFAPAVAAFSRFDWTVVFVDQRRDVGDIMLQRVYVGGTLLGSNRRINADAAGGIQTEPAVAALNADRQVISWTDVRGSSHRPHVYCRFSYANYDMTDEIPVDDDASPTANHYQSDCAIATGGVAIVVWSDTRASYPLVYGQLFDAAGAKIGGNFLIGPSTVGQFGESPVVSADSAGGFVVAYLNVAAASPAVEVKRVSTSGVVTGAFTFASDQGGYAIDGFDAGINGSGNTVLVWHGDNGLQKELFLTILNASGTPVITTTAITDDAEAAPGPAKICVDAEGYCLVTWLDNRTGQKTVYRQIFDASGNPVETNQPAYASAGSYTQPPATAGYHGKGVFVWSDARANGLKVYASQILYSPTGTDDQPEQLPTAFTLEQNHPNPFNPATTIRFDLPASGYARLEVFNIAGQRVRTLADGFLAAGSHAVVWDGRADDGRPVASGVYLYRLVGDGFTRTRQMILMK